MFIAFLDLLITNHQRDAGMDGEQHSIPAHSEAVAGLSNQCLNLLRMLPVAQGIHGISDIALFNERQLPGLTQRSGGPFDVIYKFL